jgi:hypothetical protein
MTADDVRTISTPNVPVCCMAAHVSGSSEPLEFGDIDVSRMPYRWLTLLEQKLVKIERL